MKTNKVFLGGTCATSTWRVELTTILQIDYFNPVVEDWTPECMAIENHEKAELCNIHLYVLTSASDSVYSIAEVVQSSLTKGKSTILHIIPSGFSKERLKHLDAVCQLVSANGAIAYIDKNLSRTARVINNAYKTTDFS